jgi:hypothetical protein
VSTSIEKWVDENNRLDAFGVFAHGTGCISDLGVDFEVRDRRGWLIGHDCTNYGWDGEKPCEWVRDPWACALAAVRMALAWIEAHGLYVAQLGEAA